MKTSKRAIPFFLISLIYFAFIALGMPDGIFGVAWPTMRKGFGVPIDAMGAVMITGTAGYLLSGFFSGRLISGISIGGLLTFSCGLTGMALIGDCLVPSWIWFVLIGFAQGFGGGGIDAGLNTYVAANLGNRQMHWMHACYGIGVTTGPFMMTAALQAFHDWRPGYLAVGALQLALALAFVFSIPSWKRFDGSNRKQGKKFTDYDTSLLETLSHAPVWMSMLLFVLYTGAEASLGFWAYSILTEARGVAPAIAGVIAGGYYAMFTLGRIFSGIYSKHITVNTIIISSLTLALTGSLLLWFNINPVISLAGMVLAGFAVAPVFPSLVSGTQARVGDRHAGNAIGMQMAAASIGSAVMPALMGILAGRTGVEGITGAMVVLFVAIILLYVFVARRGVKND
ncbi:MAG: MFS transporter [Spirochaetia bacterium]|nr:MFS transporter [Spirochaetia bacterium]